MGVLSLPFGPCISIVIPTCNRPELLRACLDSIARACEEFKDIEVIVSDDGREYPARSLVESRNTGTGNVRWVEGPRRGPAANRNNGALHAKGEWLIFTDDDCLPDAEWVRGYRMAMALNPDARVLEGATIADRPRRSFREVAPINDRGGYLWSCNFAISHALFNEVGRFDERFPYAAMEDVDFKYRIDQAGQRIVFVPKAVVVHPWREDKGWAEYVRHTRSTQIYLSIHPEERARLNTLYFLREIVGRFRRETLPGLWKYKGNGVSRELLRHVARFRAMVVIGMGGSAGTPAAPAEHG